MTVGARDPTTRSAIESTRPSCATSLHASMKNAVKWCADVRTARVGTTVLEPTGIAVLEPTVMALNSPTQRRAPNRKQCVKNVPDTKSTIKNKYMKTKELTHQRCRFRICVMTAHCPCLTVRSGHTLRAYRRHEACLGVCDQLRSDRGSQSARAARR